MIGKVCPRGQDVAGLIRYLYGPGRREEHTDPHIVAGYRPPQDLEPPLRANGTRDFRRLVGLLRLPHDALGKWGYAKPVWHCSMRAAPEDRLLSDAEWAGIARDVMHRTGLCPRGQEDDAVRWIAIRHGPDHIHLVAMLARQDRTRPRVWNERYRVRDACLAAEREYGLRSTAPADRTAAHRPTRAETGKAERQHRGEPARLTLRRHVSIAAASASSTTEFFARLDQAGVLVRLRYSTKNPGQVTGYAVALPGDTTKAGEPVWYGGGKLAADLTWPKLQQRWTRPARPDTPLTDAETDALWEYAARTTADATGRIRFYIAAGNPAAAADAACAASDALHVAAAAPCAAPPMNSTVPPASPGGGYLPRPRPGTSSATPPGSSPPTPTSPGTVPSPRSCCWSGSPRWPKPSPSCANPSSAPPRPPPRCALPGTCAPQPGPPRPVGHQAGPPPPPHQPSRNQLGRARPPPPSWPSSASPPRPGPADPHQASQDPAPATHP